MVTDANSGVRTSERYDLRTQTPDSNGHYFYSNLGRPTVVQVDGPTFRQITTFTHKNMITADATQLGSTGRSFFTYLDSATFQEWDYQPSTGVYTSVRTTSFLQSYNTSGELISRETTFGDGEQNERTLQI